MRKRTTRPSIQRSPSNYKQLDVKKGPIDTGPEALMELEVWANNPVDSADDHH